MSRKTKKQLQVSRLAQRKRSLFISNAAVARETINEKMDVTEPIEEWTYTVKPGITKETVQTLFLRYIEGFVISGLHTQ